MTKVISANIEELPEQELVQKGLKLPVMELFYTLQGEGGNTGMPAIFLRLAGCDVGCHWCDVKESWIATDHELLSIEEIVERLNEFDCVNVVVTGGEPLMYNLQALTNLMILNGFKTMIETSGAYPLTGEWHWICVSPKKTKPPIKDVLDKADELKVVVYNNSDFEWAESHLEFTNEEAKLYLQVEWGKKDLLNEKIIDYIKRNPKWNLSLQTHKYLDIP